MMLTGGHAGFSWLAEAVIPILPLVPNKHQQWKRIATIHLSRPAFLSRHWGVPHTPVLGITIKLTPNRNYTELPTPPNGAGGRYYLPSTFVP